MQIETKIKMVNQAIQCINSSLEGSMTSKRPNGITSLPNVTQMLALDDEADDAIWILTSTFIIFTMQSGKSH